MLIGAAVPSLVDAVGLGTVLGPGALVALAAVVVTLGTLVWGLVVEARAPRAPRRVAPRTTPPPVALDRRAA
jgi:hypothetical protein